MSFSTVQLRKLEIEQQEEQIIRKQMFRCKVSYSNTVVFSEKGLQNIARLK